MNIDERYGQAQHWLTEDMDGEVLLFNTEKLITVVLNPSSAIVWRLCDGETSIKTMISRLKQDFPTQSTQIHQDVLNALKELVNLGLIEKR